MAAHIISTGDPRTFDSELQAFFDQHVSLIRSYHERDAELEVDRRAGGMRHIMEPNPIADAYIRFREAAAELFKSRTVRCWHYTRLTVDEIDAIRNQGIVPGTVESMEARLMRQVVAGRLSEADRLAIIAASPLRFPDQAQARLGMFWVTDRALHPSDGGVEPLLGHWGGEVVYFYLQDDELIERLQGLGSPAVLELAVPVSSTTRAYGFAESALSSVVEALGYPPRLRGIDAYLNRPLGAEGVLAIHTPSDASFSRLGVSQQVRARDLERNR